VVEFVLSLADALRLRFTISPLCETVRLARTIANPTCIEGPRKVWLRRRRQSVEALLCDPDLRSLFALLSAPRDYHPDFLAPRPSGPIGDIQVEVAQIRATPDGRDFELREEADKLELWSPTWTVATKTRASARRSRTRRWFGVDMARLLPAFVAAPDP